MLSANTHYHGTEESFFREAKNSIQKGIDEGRLSQSDSQLINQYALTVKPKVSPCRYHKIVSMLVNVRRYFSVEYISVGEFEYLDALTNIKYAKKEDGTPYSANTICDWAKIVKRFFLFLESRKLTKVPLTVINETETGGYNIFTKTENDVLTADEINAIIEHADTLKYKAYFSLLYELGARSIELANLRWQDLTFYKWGVSCNLRDAKAGKVPKVRTVPCIMYQKYLCDLRSIIGESAQGENLVFTTNGNPVIYRTIQKALERFVKDAGIEKNVTLHRFRHSRITHVLRAGMPETTVKKMFWGNLSTNMISCYGHLTAKDIEKECMKMAGVEVESDITDEAPKPIVCPRCHTILPPNAHFCHVCGCALTQETIKDVEEAQRIIDDNISHLSDLEKIKYADYLAHGNQSAS